MTIYIVNVWGLRPKGGHRIVERRRFKTEWGAHRYAAEHSTGNLGEATITTPTPTDHIGPRIAHYKQGIDTMHTTHTESTGDTMTAKTAEKSTKSTPKAQNLAQRATKASNLGTRIKMASWDDVLDLTDGQIKTRAVFPKGGLSLDVETVLRESKSTKATDRYDRAYLRFLSGLSASLPSNPTSTGIESPERRAKRRAAIRATIARLG